VVRERVPQWTPVPPQATSRAAAGGTGKPSADAGPGDAGAAAKATAGADAEEVAETADDESESDEEADPSDPSQRGFGASVSMPSFVREHVRYVGSPPCARAWPLA